MAKPLRVLLVEDSEPDAELIVHELRGAGYELTTGRVQTATELNAALDRQPWDLVLSDYTLPGFSAVGALRIVRDRLGDLPFIIVSGSVGEEQAVEVMREGAHDYVMKDNMTRLTAAVERELHDYASRQEHRQIAAQLRQSQKMEAIGQLAGGVAHDFNNLLTAILAYSESLLHQLPMGSPLRGEVSEIKKAGERASTLTRQLLAFGRRQVLKPQVVDLNGVVTNVEQLLRRVIGDHIELRTTLTPRLGTVRVDTTQMEHVILNLAVNARDAMPHGGTLSIRTGNVEFDDTDAHLQGASKGAGEYVMLRVSDTGIGMDEETQARAFEPFFTTKETGKGSGLGLAMVYGIVKQSGGSIQLHSVPNEGTTFVIYLPQVSSVSAPEPAAPEQMATTLNGTETILLVEDDELVRQITMLTLERRGYKMLVARNGTDAISRAAAFDGPIDLLITDVVMPRISGRDVALMLRQTRPQMRVLYMSGYAAALLLSHTSHGTVEPSDAAFLQKPFIATALAAKVREVLGPPAVVSGKPVTLTGQAGRTPGAGGR
jgi:signal transduction histidine kinase